MWIYTRRLSLTNRQMTIVSKGYAFTIDADGKLLSSVTPAMEKILRANPVWEYVAQNTASNTSTCGTDVGSDSVADVGSEVADVGSGTDVGSDSVADVGSEVEPPKKKRGRPKAVK